MLIICQGPEPSHQIESYGESQRLWAEVPAFAEAPALCKAPGGGSPHRQAFSTLKVEPILSGIVFLF